LKSLSGLAPKTKTETADLFFVAKVGPIAEKRFAREYDFFYETAGTGYFDRQKTAINRRIS
jgi:hypothetical protein